MHRVVDAMRVHVPAGAWVGLVQDDVVLAIECPGRCQARDAGTHDRNLHARCMPSILETIHRRASSRSGSDRISGQANRRRTANEREGQWPLRRSTRRTAPHLAPGLASRIITLIAVAIPPLGLLVVAGALWGVAVTPSISALLLFLYVVPGLGITIGFHRLLHAQELRDVRPLRAVLAILGAMTTQGPVSQWVSDHRKHHAFSDVEGDPHSPHVGFGAGVLGAMRGLWHSHVGWLFSTKGLRAHAASAATSADKLCA